MHRMGHGSMRAALIHQHASTERDRRIAQEMAALVERERRPGGDDPDGSEGVGATAHRTTQAGAHFHDRRWAPFVPVRPCERATGIEPA
jgi:hypothetical protein